MSIHNAPDEEREMSYDLEEERQERLAALGAKCLDMLQTYQIGDEDPTGDMAHGYLAVDEAARSLGLLDDEGGAR